MLLKALMPSGTRQAVRWTAILCWGIHFSTIIMGNHPLYSLLPVIASMEVHMLNDFAPLITRGSIFVSTQPPAILTMMKLLLPLILCGYGLYLLHDEPRRTPVSAAQLQEVATQQVPGQVSPKRYPKIPTRSGGLACHSHLNRW